MDYTLVKCNVKDGDDWKFSDKITLNCPKHGEWDTCTIANFLRDRTCPSCAKLSRPYKRIDDKRPVLQEVAKSAGYSIKTQLHPKIKNRDKIVVICDKGHEFPVSVENFRYGRRCPECRGKNMKTLYLNSIKCEDLGVNLIKIGITKELYHRVSTQNRKNNFDFSLWHAWDFYDVSDCKEAESRIKRTLTRPANKDFIRTNFPDGHSEIFVNTGWETYRDVSEIIEDYRTYKYTPNKELNAFLEEMFKDNIVR